MQALPTTHSQRILLRNNVTTVGTGGTAMLFAHGFGCDQNMWRFVAPAFTADHRVVLMDHIGSGRADRSAHSIDRHGTLLGYAMDVLDVCDALDLRDAIFVGHSVSAMIGLLAAQRDPRRFSSLIMLGPSPRYVNDGDYVGGFERADIDELLELIESNHVDWTSKLAALVMRNPDRPELTQELADSFCSMDPTIARHFARVTFLSDTREDLAYCRTPCLIMQCTDDIIAPMPVGEYVRSRIPSSEFVLLRATGHCPHLSAPEETIACIRTFLQSTRGCEPKAAPA